MDQRRVERWDRDLIRLQPQRDLRATEDHALRALRDLLIDDAEVARLRCDGEDLFGEFIENILVDECAIGFLRG